MQLKPAAEMGCETVISSHLDTIERKNIMSHFDEVSWRKDNCKWIFRRSVGIEGQIARCPSGKLTRCQR